MTPDWLWQTLLSCMNSKRGHENCNMTDHLKHALEQASAEGRIDALREVERRLEDKLRDAAAGTPSPEAPSDG